MCGFIAIIFSIYLKKILKRILKMFYWTMYIKDKIIYIITKYTIYIYIKILYSTLYMSRVFKRSLYR